jgi:nicotinic acid mononucleotide adenylyltransferase
MHLVSSIIALFLSPLSLSSLPLYNRLTTGSFNPVHKRHIDIMLLARKYIETRGFEVIRGYISPSHDSYLRAKTGGDKKQFVSSKLRVDMCELAISEAGESSWLKTSSWESSQLHFFDYPQVVQSLSTSLSVTFTHSPCHVFYVCGFDHAWKCGIFTHGLSKNPLEGVIVLPRDGESMMKMDEAATAEKMGVFSITSSDTHDDTLSSTMVKMYLSQGSETLAEEYVGKGVMDYIREHSLYGILKQLHK